MAKYVFCPWMPPTLEGVKNVAKTIHERTKGWTKAREKKGKEGYTFVCWMGKKDTCSIDGQPPQGKVTLKDDDQVYIKGHHQAGASFISDITKQEEDESEGTFKAIMLKPEDLAWRFFDCFDAPITWLGKIKFYNCSSGRDGGASFAKPAADRLRAYLPIATYIGYKLDLSQLYTKYSVPESELEEEKASLRAMLLNTHTSPIIERRKVGLTKVQLPGKKKAEYVSSNIRAKNLQVEIRL
jgi:hypothetical protein